MAILARIGVALLSIVSMINGGYWEARHAVLTGSLMGVMGILGLVFATGAQIGQAER